MTAPSGALGAWWLDSAHPVFTANVDLWKKNERRLRGGDEVLEELNPFDWETLGDFQEPPAERDDEIDRFEVLAPGEHLQRRKDMATYLNFPDMCATALVGQLMQKAPKPGGDLDFGGLGQVQRESNESPSTRAEIVYYNADGAGVHASGWDTFWASVEKWAMATGFRWVMAEAPFIAPATMADELKGRRPYLVHYSPISVPNWHFNREGQLEFAIIRFAFRNPDYTGSQPESKKDGQFAPDLERYGYYVLVRRGFGGFGSEYAGGGWWQFDDLRQPMLNAHGEWDKTDGEIPMWPHFYERDIGTVDKPAMGRCGLTELGNCAVAFMNISSCADFNATEAAGSVKFISGCDREGYNLAMGLIKRGSRYAPLPNDAETGKAPGVQDGTGGQVASGVFESRLKAKREEAREIASLESTSTAESSGLSLQGKQNSERNPRLALMASEMESSQNKALYFLEKRFGISNPSGATHWTRDFDLIELVDRIEDFFKLEALTGLRSPTLDAKAMVQAAKDRQVLTDGTEATTVQGEYEKSAKMMAEMPPAPQGVRISEPGATVDRPPPKGGEPTPQLKKGKKSLQRESRK